MKVFLIRHGETVDNVAQVYAGVRDSALTVHGVLQAERLGKYLAEQRFHFTQLFSSDLQRASKTANILQSWQIKRPHLAVTELKILREQDFGHYEGKPFYARAEGSAKSGIDNHRSQHQNDPAFKDVESNDLMDLRMNQFLNGHLLPIIHKTSKQSSAIAIVSHGIVLSRLWKCILKILPKNSVSLSPGLSLGNGAVTSLEHLGGWSNTGFLELEVHKKELGTESGISVTGYSPGPLHGTIDGTALVPNIRVEIKTVNGKKHLESLKRTKGGVGSSKFDEGQKSIDSFFKKRKV